MLDRRFLRTGLSNPSVPAGTLEDLCREFCVEEGLQISRTYISQVRDAFCEVVKGMSRVEVASRVGREYAQGKESPRGRVIRHVHGGATMRVKSYMELGGSGPSLGPGARARSRYSKILNYATSVHLEDDVGLEWFTELQPLLKEDGVTTGRALTEAVGELIDTALRACESTIRGVRILVGNGSSRDQDGAGRKPSTDGSTSTIR